MQQIAAVHVGLNSSSTRPFNRLTRAEAEILRLYAMGMTSEEIAVDLGTTAVAVRGHLKSAMVKLGAHSKLEAIILAVRSGQITRPS